MTEKNMAMGLILAGAALGAMFGIVMVYPGVAGGPAPGGPAPAGSGPSHHPPSRAMVTTAVSIAAPVGKAAIPCSIERLDAWTLVGLEAGPSRHGAYAVLSHERRGTLMVFESQVFDGNLLLEKVDGKAVELRCGATVQSKTLADGHAGMDAAPAMRVALPEPSDR
ncbi:hypothetical protein AAKU55_004137 [Oxalobacteraceae bacterium GrIS 1.11]